MAVLPVYDKDGAHVGEMEVPTTFADTPQAAVLHQIVRAQLASRRQGTASTKTRSEVAGSNRKLWRQKGTGRARVGDRRPPNRVGGGTVGGPRPRSYRERTPARVKQEALRSALGARVAAGDVLVLESLELAAPKTRAVQSLLDAIGASGSLLLVLPDYEETVWQCGRNIRGLTITAAAEVSAYGLMAARTVILTKQAVSRLEARLA